mgnify:CR=1 FL=1
MEFVELTEQEYENYWKTHPLKTFLSAKEIGKLREKRNWKVYYVGLKEKNKIYGAAMLLGSKKKFNMHEFYSPRGFLIDYNNKSLLELFTKEISTFIKKKKGYILRIDPYVINKERDINGNIIEDGINNKNIINSLKNIGFKKVPSKNNEQVSWMFSLDLEGKTEDEILNEMKPNTRNIIRKAEKSGITIKELSFDELPKFNNIIKDTGKRRNFTTREKDYYEDMYILFHPKNEVKYYITELNLKDYVEKLTKEKHEKEIKLEKIKKCGKKEELKKDIDLLTNKIVDAEAIRNKTNSDIITLSGSMFMLIQPEIIYLSSGNYEEYMKFNSQYLLQWELIKYGIKNGFKKHNFYGIPENINNHPDNYGIYEFKKGFNGYVEELIGEYELPLSIYYYIFKLFNKLKEVKYALHL